MEDEAHCSEQNLPRSPINALGLIYKNAESENIDITC